MSSNIFNAKTGKEVYNAVLSGDSPDSRDDDYTPLIYACISGNLEVVIELVKMGANIEYTIFLWNTPITYAASYGHLDIVKFLCESGANIERVLSCAVNGGAHIDIIDYLLSFHSKKLSTFDVQRAFYSAITRQSVDVIDRILDYGIDLNCRTLYEYSYLMVAAAIGNLTIFDKLIIYGANIYYITDKQETAYTMAYKHENKNILTRLYELGYSEKIFI